MVSQIFNPSSARPLVRCACIFSFMLAIGMLLLHFQASSGLYAPDQLFLQFKANLAYYGSAPKLPNLLLVGPIVPYTVVLLFGGQLLWAQAVLFAFYGSGVILFLTRLVSEQRLSFLSAAALALLLGSPQILFMATQEYSNFFLLFLMLLATYMLRKYYAEALSGYLFFFGLSVGCMAYQLLAYPVFWLLFLPTLLIITVVQKRPLVPILVAAYLPAIVFTTAPLALSSLLGGVFSPGGSEPAVQSLNELVVRGIAAAQGVGKTIGRHWLILLPYFYLCLRLFQYSSFLVYFSFLIIPCLALWCSIYSGNFSNHLSDLNFFLVSVPIFLTKSFTPRLQTHFLATPLFASACLISFIASFIAMQTSFDPKEKQFYSLMTGGVHSTELNAQQHLGNAIHATHGSLLSDDSVNFIALEFGKHFDRYILPYQPIFRTAALYPEEFADNILLNPVNTEDRLTRRYPRAILGELNGYTLIFQNEAGFLFRKQNFQEGALRDSESVVGQSSNSESILRSLDFSN